MGNAVSQVVLCFITDLVVEKCIEYFIRPLNEPDPDEHIEYFRPYEPIEYFFPLPTDAVPEEHIEYFSPHEPIEYFNPDEHIEYSSPYEPIEYFFPPANEAVPDEPIEYFSPPSNETVPDDLIEHFIPRPTVPDEHIACFIRPLNVGMVSRSIRPNFSHKVYGGNMAIVGDQAEWSKPRASTNNMQYLKAESVINLDVRGSISLPLLLPRTSYKCALDLRVDRTWDNSNRVAIQVSIPGGPTLRKTYSVRDNGSLWTTDSFTTPSTSIGVLEFRIFSRNTSVKRGLTLKYFVVKPA